MSYEVTRPGGDLVRLDATKDADGLRYTDTNDIGIYKVRRLTGGDQRESAIAINLEPGELPGAISSVEAVSSIVGESRLVVCDDPKQISSTMGQLRQGRSLMEFFLIAVMILLIAEAYVANRRVDQEQPDQRREQRSAQPGYRRLPAHLQDLAEMTRR